MTGRAALRRVTRAGRAAGGSKVAAALQRAFHSARDTSAAIVEHCGDVLNGASFHSLEGNSWLQVRGATCEALPALASCARS